MSWITKSKLLTLLVVLVVTGGVVSVPFLLQHSNQKSDQPHFSEISQVQAKSSDEHLGEVLGVQTSDETPSILPKIFVPSSHFHTPTTLASSSNSGGTSSDSSSNPTSTPSPDQGVSPTLQPTKSPVPNSTVLPTATPTTSTVPKQTILEILVGSNVTVQAPGEGAKQGVQGQVVLLGSTISTGADTQAQLVYPTGGVTRLDSNTQVQLNEIPSSTTGGNILIVAGRTWQRVKKVLGLDSYETETATALASVRGTSYGHSIEKDVNGDPVDRIVTLEGKVAVKCKQRSSPEVLVNVNKDLRVSCKAKNYDPQLADIPGMSDSEIQWVLSNLIRDEQLKKRFKDVQFGDPENPEAVFSENKPPVVNAGPDQVITVGDRLKLQGEVSDDNMPFKAKPVTLWSSLDTGAVVLSSDLTTLKASATYSKPGTYRFRLTASDLALQSSDEVTVVVLPVNTVPVVNMGPDRTTLPYTPFQVTPVVTDDGLPNNTLTYEWDVSPDSASNPKVVISDPAAANPTFTFYSSGAYKIGLRVSDGVLKTTKRQLAVTVSDPPAVSITTATPKFCNSGTSCFGITTMEVNGVNFNDFARVKLKLNNQEILGSYVGGDQNTQILTDFVNLECNKSYKAFVYFVGPLDSRQGVLLDQRTAHTENFKVACP